MTYNFNANGTATNADPAVTGGTVTGGGGLSNFVVSTPLTYPNNVMQVNPGTGSTTLSAAIVNNSFYTFTISGTVPGYSLDTIDLKAARGGAAVARGFAVASSLTGTTILFQDDEVDSLRPNLTDYQVNLTTNPAFDSITGDVVFTVYIYTPDPGNSLEFDDIVVSGVVPEPSALVLSALGALTLLRRRR